MAGTVALTVAGPRPPSGSQCLCPSPQLPLQDDAPGSLKSVFPDFCFSLEGLSAGHGPVMPGSAAEPFLPMK